MAEIMIKDINGNDVKLVLTSGEFLKLKAAVAKGYGVEIISVAWRLLSV